MQKENNPKVSGIKLKEDGTYCIDCVKLLEGKRAHIYSSGFSSLEEAMEALPILVKKKVEAYEEKQYKNMTFAVFFKKFDDYRLLHVRLSSVQFSRSVVNTYCQGWMEMEARKCFSYKQMETLYSSFLRHQGVPSWKNRCFGVFRQMAEMAFKWRIIDSSSYQDAMTIFENIPENRGAKKEKDIWNKKERERFFSCIEDETDLVIFSLLSTLGLRIGEFSGLTWDCYDEKKGAMEIKQQLIYEQKGRRILTGQLKTRESYRVCILPSKMNQMLREYKKKTEGKGFIFASDRSGNDPLSKSSLRRKLYFYIEKAGVRKITPHSFRHAKATALMKVCKNMQEVKAAARYLGHSATMMIDTYGHSEMSATEAVLRRLEKEEA
ncbi:MAG: site-specific integrase [Bacilli bacterium]|nr:site-specific integrase [Bacilli bacterium]